MIERVGGKVGVGSLCGRFAAAGESGALESQLTHQTSYLLCARFQPALKNPPECVESP